MSTRLKVFIGEIALILMVVIWGSTFYLVKELLSSVDAVAMLVYRFAAAAAIMAAVLALRGKPLFKGFFKGGLVGVFMWVLYASQNIGMVETTASNSGFITGLFVIFVPVFGLFFFKTTPPLMRVFAALLAVFGLWKLTGSFGNLNRGDVITMLAPVSCALYVLFSDKSLKEGFDPYVLCFQQFFTVAVFSLLWVVIFRLPLAVASMETYLVMLYLAVAATVLTFVVYTLVQKVSTPMKCSLILALEPVAAALFAWKFGGEVFTRGQMLGGAMIVIAMMISEIPVESWRLRILRCEHVPNHHTEI